MVEHHEDADRLETLLVATSEFAANAIVVVLEDAGIEARAFGTIQGGLGFPLGHHTFGWGTPVQVRASDLERAQNALDQARRDSVDIDWDSVELGEPEGSPPPMTTGMPIPARLAFSVTAIMVLVLLVVAVLMLFA
jgi:hypothetical protein